MNYSPTVTAATSTVAWAGRAIDVSPREGSAGFEKTKTLAKTWALASAVELHHLSILPWSQRV